MSGPPGTVGAVGTASSSAQQAQFWATLPALHVVDVETTGTEASDRIISVGFVKVLRGKTLDTWSSLVDPAGRRISPGAHRVHGLVAADLVGAPTFDSLREAVTRWLTGDIVIVGHNLGFDITMLRSAFEDCGVPLPRLVGMDTMALATAAGVASGRIALGELLERLGLANSAAHTAVGDALATAQAAVALLGTLAESGYTDLSELTFTTDTLVLPQLSAEDPDEDVTPDTDEHHEAHRRPLLSTQQRKEALDYCLSVGCSIVHRRMQDALAGPEEARWVVEWAVRKLVAATRAAEGPAALSRVLAGRLLAGIGRAVPRVRDSRYARTTYKKLLPVFTHFGACSDVAEADARCDCCQGGSSLCRFLRVRRNLVHAFIHVKFYDNSPARNAKRTKVVVPNLDEELDRATRFLPVASPKEASVRGGARVGFFHELVKNDHLDAAGYGAAQAARIRRQRKGLEWSRRTLQVAWDKGCRNLSLTDDLTALISTGSGAGRPQPRTQDETLADLRLARAHLQEADGANAGVWEGRTRRDVLDRRAASLDVRIARLEAALTPTASAVPQAEPQSRGTGVRNTRPARRLLLGQLRAIRVEQDAEELLAEEEQTAD